MKISEFLFESKRMDSSYEIRNLNKLDYILVKLTEMILKGQEKEPNYYGMVAAAVLDPDNNLVARLNYPNKQEKRIHAERAAVNAYNKKYGKIPDGSIIITTLSPCSDPMDERAGESCTNLVNQSNIHKVYCGYIDPSQHDHDSREFTLQETNNVKLRKICKQLADTFLQYDKKPHFKNKKVNTHEKTNESIEQYYISQGYTIINVEDELLEDLRTQLAKSPDLFENNENFKSLHAFISTYEQLVPKIGEKYSPMTILSMPIGAVISYSTTLRPLELISIDKNVLTFKDGNKIRKFPEGDQSNNDLLKYTLIFTDNRDQEKFVTILKLKFSDWNFKNKVISPSINESIDVANFKEILKIFLSFAQNIVKLDTVPKIKLRKTINDVEQPTHGQFHYLDSVIELSIANRHPVDILRTLAHELVHAKQLQDGVDIDPSTGSKDENEANAIAGVIIRKFNKKYPKYLSFQSVKESEINGRKRI